jgi:predicted enzyme related to lactoylglutathione lyase
MTDSSRQTPRTALVLYAKDVHRVAQFYRLALALETAEGDDGFLVLRGHAIELTVVRIPQHIAAGVEIGTPPVIREDTPFKPSFMVPDLQAVREAVAATGGQLKPSHEEWRFRGALHVDGWDPEGNVVQFRQAAD